MFQGSTHRRLVCGRKKEQVGLHLKSSRLDFPSHIRAHLLVLASKFHKFDDTDIVLALQYTVKKKTLSNRKGISQNLSH
jgi:hypothetical protein